jgi:hypothetical protein
LIEISTIDDAGFDEAAQHQQLGKFIRFHHMLDINIEGIKTITNFALYKHSAV